MFPTLLRLGSFSLSTYGVLVALGYVASVWWLQSRRDEMGVDEERLWEFIYWIFGGALLGAKLGFALAEHDVTRLWRDVRYGFVFYGGFLGAVLAGWIVARRRALDFVKLSDYFGVALPLGHAIGRLGCLAAGCCYGRHTDLPWGVPLAGDLSRHPTQVYEALANAAIAVVVARAGLERVRGGRWRPGSAFLLYVALYAAARFLIEFARADDRGGFGLGLSPSQWVAAAALLAVGFISWRRQN